MRILFIAPYVPSLIRVRPYNWIRSLAGLGHELTVVALGTDGPLRDEEAREALLPFCEDVIVVPHSQKRAAMHCALSLMTMTPLWAAYCHSPAMQTALRGLLAIRTFDVAHIEHLRAAHFAADLPPELPIIFDAVDCITELQRQMSRAAGRGLFSRALSGHEHARLKRYEPRQAANCARTIITSITDANALRALADPLGLEFPIDVLPNGVDLEYFHPAASDGPIGRNVVFSGKMSYAANHDAALYLARSIWPRILKACPDATLTIAGSGPKSEVRALAGHRDLRIEVTGYAADLRPLLSRASVAVCPVRIGVGIQNKVLEAMAMGKAVVATPLAARALQSEAAGDALCVAGSAKEFAECVIDYLTRPEEAKRVGEAARQYVEAHHSWHQLAVHLTEIYVQAQATAQVAQSAASHVEH